MKKSLLILALLTSQSVFAASYTYTVNIINKTSNATVYAIDKNSSPAINRVAISNDQKPKTLSITDDGKSLELWIDSIQVCAKPGMYNFLDFSTPLRFDDREFNVTVIGSYTNSGYQFNCMAL